MALSEIRCREQWVYKTSYLPYFVLLFLCKKTQLPTNIDQQYKGSLNLCSSGSTTIYHYLDQQSCSRFVYDLSQSHSWTMASNLELHVSFNDVVIMAQQEDKIITMDTNDQLIIHHQYHIRGLRPEDIASNLGKDKQRRKDRRRRGDGRIWPRSVVGIAMYIEARRLHPESGVERRHWAKFPPVVPAPQAGYNAPSAPPARPTAPPASQTIPPLPPATIVPRPPATIVPRPPATIVPRLPAMIARNTATSTTANAPQGSELDKRSTPQGRNPDNNRAPQTFPKYTPTTLAAEMSQLHTSPTASRHSNPYQVPGHHSRVPDPGYPHSVRNSVTGAILGLHCTALA